MSMYISSGVHISFKHWAYAVVVALLLLSSSILAATETANRDARNQIATALYNASATQAAAERDADQTIRKQRREIDALQIQLADVRAQANDNQVAVSRADWLQQQLTAAKENYIAELAKRDRAYAQEIAVFRNAVEDIASTPEGAAALAKFNAGKEVEALSILDKLRAARDAARKKRMDIESAAEARRIATLALEARNKGKVTTRQVIERFEEVTKLDPHLHSDWVELCRLYTDAGNLPQALHAAKSAQKTAVNDRDLSVAFGTIGDVQSAQGDLDGALQSYRASLNIAERLAKADPGNAGWQRDLIVSYVKLSEISKNESWVKKALSVALKMQERGILAPRDSWMIEELQRRSRHSKVKDAIRPGR